MTSILLDHVYSSLHNTEKITVRLLQGLKSHVAQYKRNLPDQPLFSRFLGLNYLLIFLFFPMYILYWCYLYPVFLIYITVSKYLHVPIKILRRRSSLLNALVSHVSEILAIADMILQKALTSKISELLAFCISTAIEISLAMIWPFQQQPQQTSVPTAPMKEKSASVNELFELVRYEELAPDECSSSMSLHRKTARNMHNYIPLNPFRATVKVKNPIHSDGKLTLQDNPETEKVVPCQRVPSTVSTGTFDAVPIRPQSPSSTTRSVLKALKFLRKIPTSIISFMLEEAPPNNGPLTSIVRGNIESVPPINMSDMDAFAVRPVSPLDDEATAFSAPDIDIFNIDSPASFPSSPFSRAYVMNRASERVVSVLFAARDRLRLEAQSVSRDEFSRLAAREAQSHGQSAIFDSRQISAGIALTCGNHCAVKVGKGLVSSCRGMIPVRPNTFVYFEMSITVSSNQAPHLAIGIAPRDSPLNVMVGSWARSVGLYNDGQIMVGSKWFPSLSQQSNRNIEENSSTVSVPAVSGDKIVAGSTVGLLVYLPGSHSLGEVSASAQENLQPETSCPSITRDRSFSLSSVSRSRTVSIAVATAMQLSHPLVHFNINGQPVNYSSEVPEALKELCDTVDAPLPSLFPTVSLFSEDTRVWCRFCEADIVYRDRDTIRAPPGARVYCLDGSLLLSEKE